MYLYNHPNPLLLAHHQLSETSTKLASFRKIILSPHVVVSKKMFSIILKCSIIINDLTLPWIILTQQHIRSFTRRNRTSLYNDSNSFCLGKK